MTFPNSQAITGFDPADDKFSIISSKFVGQSGTDYVASSIETLTVGSLSTLYPDYDLAPFQGDPNGKVIAITTTVPSSEFAVPEPGTLGLAAVAALGLFGRRNRAR